MKAGIWGAGGIAASHAEALASAGVTLSAVVDRSEGAACAFQDRWGAQYGGTDAAQLLAPDIDAVHICTPPNLHYEMAKLLLEHGKHVLCEKPLCLEAEQAFSLAELARRHNRVCAVNLNVRYHAACQRARALVGEAEYGPVTLVHGSYLQEFHALPAPYGWRYDENLAGPMRAVTEIGTHWMDLAQYISGLKIKRVSALFGRHSPVRYLEEESGLMYAESAQGRTRVEVASEDSAAITVQFENGALGSLVLSEVAPGRSNRLSIEVTGRGKNLWWNSEAIGALHVGQKGQGYNTEVFAFGDNGFNGSFRGLVSGFYAAVKGNKEEMGRLPSFADGAAVAAICAAVYESAMRDCAWVEVKTL